jgi:hypothetical protein
VQSYEGWVESRKTRIRAIEEELYLKAAVIEKILKEK